MQSEPRISTSQLQSELFYMWTEVKVEVISSTSESVFH